MLCYIVQSRYFHEHFTVITVTWFAIFDLLCLAGIIATNKFWMDFRKDPCHFYDETAMACIGERFKSEIKSYVYKCQTSRWMWVVI